MTLSDSGAEALRRAFDRGFAELPSAARTEGRSAFLAIRVGGDPYALRLAELAGLYADRRVVPVPTQARELLGIAAFRGVLAPIYDLRVLLGYPAGAAPRWLVLCRAPALLGLAFEVFEGHLRSAVEPGGRLVRADGVARPVLVVPSLFEKKEH